MNEESSATEWKPKARVYWTMACLSMISLAVALDSTIIATSLPTIAQRLNGSSTAAFWVGTSYLLTCAVCQPFISALSDVFGRAPLLIVVLIFFTVGSLTASLARGLSTLLIARSIQGIGGGGIITMTLVVVSDIIPLRHRPRWYGIIQAAWAIGTAAGPFLGGLFVQYSSWRWIFYVNLPLCGVGLIAAPFSVRTQAARGSLKEKLSRVDWIGGAAFTASLTSFLMAISWGGVQYKWAGFETLVPLVLGLIGVVTSLWWECRWAKTPFLRRSLMPNKSAVAAYLLAVRMGYSVFSQLYYIPLYFQSVKAKSPIATGVSVLPITGSLMPSAVLVGYLITSIGRYRWAVWLGELVTTLATGMLILWDAETSPTVINAVLVILGLGNGLSLSSLYTAIQAAVDERDAPSAASMYSSVRSIGMALGVPIGGSAFQNLMKEKLRQEHLPTSIASHAESDLDIFKALPDTSPFRNSVTQAYVAGCRGVFEIMTGVSVLGLILCLLIKDYPIDRRAEDIHVLPSREATADAEMVPVANGVSK